MSRPTWPRAIRPAAAFLSCLLAILLSWPAAAPAQGFGPTPPAVQTPGLTVPLPGSQLSIVGTQGPVPPAPQPLGGSLTGKSSTGPSRCPLGYVEDDATRRLPHLVICEVASDPRMYCGAQPGYYACGVNGKQCCAPNTDNICFPGSYACTPQTSLAGPARTACCIGS